MVDRIPGPRRKLRRIAKRAKAVKRLHDTGILDLGNLGMTLETAKNAGVYGPQAALAIQGGRKYPSLPAVVDERGTLTYKQVDDESTALARGLNQLGVGAGSVVGLLCRDHRGLIIAMAACGKLGARLVLMNTGFAKPQFAEVCAREEREGGTSRQRVLGPARRAARRPATGAHAGWTRGRDPPAVCRRSTTSSRRTPRTAARTEQAGRVRHPHQRDDRVAERCAQGQGVAIGDSGAGRPDPLPP